MLTVQKQEAAGKTVYTISGTIDEKTDLAKELGTPTQPFVVVAKGITRINSVGVKNWIRFFSTFGPKQIVFSFEQLSPTLVEQLNAIQNFNCGGTVNSIVMPYLCAGCKTELIVPIKTADIVKLNNKVPDVKCPKCSGNAAFDEFPEEYFEFCSRG